LRICVRLRLEELPVLLLGAGALRELVLRRGEQPGVVERDGDHAGERLEGEHVRLTEGAGRRLLHVEHRQHLAAELHRDRDLGPRRSNLRESLDVLPVGGHVVGENGGAPLRRGADQPGPHRHGVARLGQRGESAGDRLPAEGSGARIVKQQHDVEEAERRLDLPHRGLEEIALFEPLRQHDPETAHRGELAQAPLRGLLGQPLLADVEEERGELARPGAERADLEPLPERAADLVEADRTAAERHVAVGLDPFGLDVLDHLLDGPADRRGLQSGEREERGVGVEEPVVDRAAAVVADDLVQGETLAHRREQRAVPLLAVAQRLLDALALGEIGGRDLDALDLTGGGPHGGVVRQHPPGTVG